MTEHLFETVAAVSTPRGKGGVAMIRISGGDTAAVCDKCFRAKSGRLTAEIGARRAAFGEIHDGARVIDTGILTYYESPHSYTGEDMAEITCHGGVYVTRCVLEAVLRAGAVMADAGDFTRRAFINGKLTLSEAQAVGNLIDADTDSRMRLASGAARGTLAKKCAAISEKLSGIMSALYAAIDYPDEDLTPPDADAIKSVLTDASSALSALISTYRTGRAVAEGIRTVICGRPNCGKSSLYNALCGDDRAIVTDVAGTTRDVISDTVDVGGLTLLLSDTAGLRATDDTVEKIGVERAGKCIDESELVISVFDGSVPLTDDERERIQKITAPAKIAVINKNDLPCALDESDLDLIRRSHDCTISVSALTGDGIGKIADALTSLYGDAGKISDTSPVIWDAHQLASLESAHEMLDEALGGLIAGDPTDAVCTLCESAIAEIGMVDGRQVSEDIVNGIFAKFCVGK